VVVRLAGHAGDLGWVVMAHGEIYSEEFGWDSDFELLVARIVTAYASGHDADREALWIAELDGERVGCVMCLADELRPRMARLRILLVDRCARGRGLGGRLVELVLEFARASGYEGVVLWTNDPLKDAQRLYRARGFELVSTERHRSFGVDLLGAEFELHFG
jgi:GNAT superfamily N-acetyltransferase